MKVFVTGGAGYIGSVTCECLLDKGHDVTVFDNLERGHREAVDPRARFIMGDLRDAGSINSAMADVKPEAVMHFAAYALVPESMTSPEIYYRNNLAGGINLAEAMLKTGVESIIFSSTCATYGQPDRIPITEETPQRPENPYGDSKLSFEKALAWYNRIYGMKTVFLRYFNACGATVKFGEDHDPETHIIPIVLQAALGRRGSVKIYGDSYDTPDGSCIRDYVHIVDLAQAHILALEKQCSGAFNLGNGNGNSVKEVVDTARRITGRDIKSEIAPPRAGDPARLVADSRKAREVLGWNPEFAGLDEIIRSAWAWLLEHPDGYGTNV